MEHKMETSRRPYMSPESPHMPSGLAFRGFIWEMAHIRNTAYVTPKQNTSRMSALQVVNAPLFVVIALYPLALYPLWGSMPA